MGNPFWRKRRGSSIASASERGRRRRRRGVWKGVGRGLTWAVRVQRTRMFHQSIPTPKRRAPLSSFGVIPFRISGSRFSEGHPCSVRYHISRVESLLNLPLRWTHHSHSRELRLIRVERRILMEFNGISRSENPFLDSPRDNRSSSVKSIINYFLDIRYWKTIIE